MKWNCPGCAPGALCPPWYNITFEGIDPRVWEIGLFTHDGDRVRHFLRPTQNGAVLSFRPSEKMFRPKTIGDYALTFESSKVKVGERVTVKTRLETSNKPTAR